MTNLEIFYFVSNADEDIHEAFTKYNVHNILHSVDDVRYNNLPLQKLSAFPFEDFMQKLKGFVKGKHFPYMKC